MYIHAGNFIKVYTKKKREILSLRDLIIFVENEES